jgi:hypothetical protein
VYAVVLLEENGSVFSTFKMQKKCLRMDLTFCFPYLRSLLIKMKKMVPTPLLTSYQCKNSLFFTYLERNGIVRRESVVEEDPMI